MKPDPAALIEQRKPHKFKLTKAQRIALLWARRECTDGRVPPYVFKDHRSLVGLLNAGLIEWMINYGAPMYQFTRKGLDALEG